jgi:aldehyde dehydrogenase (NAD+)
VIVDRTPKVYIGGSQKRPDGEYSRVIYGKRAHNRLRAIVGHLGAEAKNDADSSERRNVLAQVAEGNRKDIRNAVEAAHKAAGGWGKRAAHNRAQICYYIAENLQIRSREFAQRIHDQTGREVESCEEEVRESIQRLFHYAAYADKLGGVVQETTLYGVTLAINEPVGVIGIACPDEFPLLGFVSLIAPAIVRGNTVVVVPSPDSPLCATDLYQVFDTSDLPGGVVNIVTGERDVLSRTLAEHQDVEAIWYFGGEQGSRNVEYAAADNMKRSWVNFGKHRNWLDRRQGQGHEFLVRSIEVKNIWVPIGVVPPGAGGGY